MEITFQAYTLSDTDSGFYTEHVMLMEKLEAANNARTNLRNVINQSNNNEDQDLREKNILTAEVNKFQTEKDFFEAKNTLIDKIVEVNPDAAHLILPVL